MGFYQVFLKYCNKKGIAPSRAALNIGLSKTAANGWKDGSIPSDANIAKLAELFGITYEEFQDEIKKEAPTEIGEGSKVFEKFSQLDEADKAYISGQIDALLSKRK